MILVHDKKLGTSTTNTPMRWLAIPNVIAHPRLKRKTSAVSQARFQFAFKAQKHMSLGAPVIRLVTRRVLDQAHANLAKILRPL
jgi:hypothetical protein